MLTLVVVRPDRFAVASVYLHHFERVNESLAAWITPLQEFERKLDCLDIVPAFVADLVAQRLALENLAHFISFLPGRMAESCCHAVAPFARSVGTRKPRANPPFRS